MKIFLVLWFSIGLCIVVHGLSEADEGEGDLLVQNFRTIPESDKNDFLAYFLTLGVFKGKMHFENVADVAHTKLQSLSDDDLNKFKNMHIPPTSVNKLLTWTMKQFNLEESEVIDLATYGSVCTITGECTTITDINDLCCPW